MEDLDKTTAVALLHDRFDGDRAKILAALHEHFEGTDDEFNAMLDTFESDMQGYFESLNSAYEANAPEEVVIGPGEDPSKELISRIEDSFVAVLDRCKDQFKAVENLNGYSIDLFPWFGYIYINLRTGACDENYLQEPESWDMALFLDSQDEEIPEFDWFVNYMYQQNEKLHDEMEDDCYDDIKRWDQWLRICTSIALIGDKVQDKLKEYDLPNAGYDPLDHDFCKMFYVPAQDEGAMVFTKYNFVTYVSAMKAEKDGLSTAKLNERYL